MFGGSSETRVSLVISPLSLASVVVSYTRTLVYAGKVQACRLLIHMVVIIALTIICS